MRDKFAIDIAHHCRWALDHNDGHPLGAWSTGERLAVALVLWDYDHLKAMDYTPTEAAQQVTGGMLRPPADFVDWLNTIRAALKSNSSKRSAR